MVEHRSKFRLCKLLWSDVVMQVQMKKGGKLVDPAMNDCPRASVQPSLSALANIKSYISRLSDSFVIYA